MKHFKIPAWRERVIRHKYRRKSSVIHTAVQQMEAAMKKAIDYIFDHWRSTGQYVEPSLHDMDVVAERFYRNVVTEALASAKHEKGIAEGKRKLAKGPVGIPRRVKTPDQIFRTKEWAKIMKRSGRLSSRLRKAYLEKLRKKFNDVVPAMARGEIAPEQVKKDMMEGWEASKAQVETVFRTETTNYFGRTQVAFFEDDPDIIGFLFDSIRDVSRTKICRSRHGLVYRPGTKLLKENTPALHWNCRSHLIPLANNAYNRKLLDDPERDPATHTVEPLPRGWRK